MLVNFIQLCKVEKIIKYIVIIKVSKRCSFSTKETKLMAKCKGKKKVVTGQVLKKPIDARCSTLDMIKSFSSSFSDP